MKYILLLLLSISLVTAQTERYIIAYTNQAWNSFQQSGVSALDATSNAQDLNHLKMQIADLDADAIAALKTKPGVTLYKDQEIHTSSSKCSFVQQNPLNWGLDRIDQRNLPLDNLYHYYSRGKGVDVWIVDTGIQVNHNEFEGRATFDANFVDGIDTDCNGHGTNVASISGGVNVGVAKEVNLHAVKVLDCAGSGTSSTVLAGINYVIGQHLMVVGRKSVMNLSLGGGIDIPINLAVAAAVQAGIVVAAAAGNEAQDACQVSPASAPEAITVAASDINDISAFFTNFGQCVTLYGPGVDIYGAYIGGPDSYATYSGTSQATPHVSGAAALLLASGKAKTPAAVKAYLINKGTKDVIQNVPPQTPNILLYTWK